MVGSLANYVSCSLNLCKGVTREVTISLHAVDSISTCNKHIITGIKKTCYMLHIKLMIHAIDRCGFVNCLR